MEYKILGYKYVAFAHDYESAKQIARNIAVKNRGFGKVLLNDGKPGYGGTQLFICENYGRGLTEKEEII